MRRVQSGVGLANVASSDNLQALSTKDFEGNVLSSKIHVPSLFGSFVFSDTTSEKYVPKSALSEFKQCRADNRQLPEHVCDAYADGLKRWAVAAGVSHWAHSFSPLSSGEGAKQDSFISTTHKGDRVIMAFSGKDLRQSEADGSSFPSGGARVTHMARGYTVWDPSVAPYVVEVGDVRTLYIPAIFFGWNGAMLDKRIPLLRSQQAVRSNVRKLLIALGHDGEQPVWTNCGLEQEFFLIDREQYLKRPDLMLTGRTLLGHPSAKGQELSDHYYGDLGVRTHCIDAMDTALWKLGIPVQTRHKEVAPAQYELAPVFEDSLTACNHNVMMMRTMRAVARQHGLACLFHEKPFFGLNGSARHNNFSIACPDFPMSVFVPPKKGADVPPMFLLSVASVIRAVSLHGDLLRFSISGATNDHRLGGHEAPPAIMSVYLGTAMSNYFKKYLGEEELELEAPEIDLNVPFLPKIDAHTTDRNRTSPLAFTENRFEFRACGSSQSASDHTFILNTIVSESMSYYADRVEEMKGKMSGASIVEITDAVLTEELPKVIRSVFNGNGYSSDWVAEAEKRGLPHYPKTPDVLSVVTSDKNVDMFGRMGVLSRKELEMICNIRYDQFITRRKIEATCLRDMIRTAVIPTGFRYQSTVASSILDSVKAVSMAYGSLDRRHTGGKGHRFQMEYLRDLERILNDVAEETKKLEDCLQKADDLSEQGQSTQDENAHFCADVLLTQMDSVRLAVDRLENTVPHDLWPFPYYRDMIMSEL